MNIATTAIVGAALLGGALWSGGGDAKVTRCDAYSALDGRRGRPQGAETPEMLRAFAAADMTEALTPRVELDHSCTK
jgi:hypothetical protein